MLVCAHFKDLKRGKKSAMGEKVWLVSKQASIHGDFVKKKLCWFVVLQDIVFLQH